MKKTLFRLGLILALTAPLTALEPDTTVQLRVLETTDIHVNLVNYDYYKDAATDEFGLAKTATLIKAARAEVTNSLLFDNGDLIQGNPLGDYVARVKPLQAGETHPVYKAMNPLGYDAGNIGNHEFNYGLDFLATSLQGSKFPYVNANLYVTDKTGKAGKNYFTPYVILNKEVVDADGKKTTLRVGVIGFVPPQVMVWDKGNLEGKVVADDIVATAQKFIPEMKAKGADLIVAIAHTGFGTDAPAEAGAENAAWALSQVTGIDAILFGHSHVVFPSAQFKGKAGVDLDKGTINGVPSVEPGFWGNNLGLIDLTLKRTAGKWAVADSKAFVRPIFKVENKVIVPLVAADADLVAAVKADHEATLAWVRGPVGTTTAPINSFFSLVKDDPSIQLVNNAQKWYVENAIQGTELAKYPVLSAGAPFKAGGRSGSSYYTDIPAGTLAVKNLADLYIYSNTLKAVKLNGAQVREWLERSAGQFNRIDPTKTDAQPLVDQSFPTYNFDVIDGVGYQIDLTQPNRYDGAGKLANPDAHRIVNLTFAGKPIDPAQTFLVATNNYRAGGGGSFPGLDGKNIVIDSPDENRQAVLNYIIANKTINPSADGNWSFAPIGSNPLVVFETSPNAKTAAAADGRLKLIGDAEGGFVRYSLDLSK